MKQVILKSIHLVNWKGVKDREITFGQTTTISGDNGTGKSTIFDAFTWLLFGKDQFERKDHEITPVINEEKMDRLDSEVSAIITVDGEESALKRVLHPKWVRRRGKAVEEFDGFDTKYYVNDVPLKMAEYNEKIKTVIDDTVFKCVTNPLYFFNMVKWQDQRAVLFNMAGTITDDELALKDPSFAALLDKISGKSLEEFKREIATKKKKLNDDLKLIPAKIDQTRRLTPDVADWADLEDQKKAIDAKITAIDTEIADKVKANRESYEDIRKIQKEISDLEMQRDRLVSDAKNAEEDRVRKANREEDIRVDNANSDLHRMENQIKNDERELQKAISDSKELLNKVKDVESERDDLLKEREGLLAKWKEINGRTFVPGESCVMCPLFHKPCTDPDAAGRVSELNAKAAEEFQAKNKKDLDAVNKRGLQIKKRVEELTDYVMKSDQADEEMKSTIEALKKKIDSNRATIAGMKETKPVYISADEIKPETVLGWPELGKKIESLKASIVEPGEVDTTELQTRKSELNAERDQIITRMGDKTTIEKNNREIESLEDQSKELSQQIADIEKDEFTIEAFNKTKVDECESRINDLFSRVSWKLFDKTIKGDEFECCIPTNKKGVAISTTNTADVINCGLDVINVLCRYYGVTAPIFIDNRESVSELIHTESQIINLEKVKGQKELKVESL